MCFLWNSTWTGELSPNSGTQMVAFNHLKPLAAADSTNYSLGNGKNFAGFCDMWWFGKHSIQDAGNPFIPALPRAAWYGASQTLETCLKKKIISLQVN